MLWKKESNEKNALYVNIFESSDRQNEINQFFQQIHISNPTSSSSKNDAAALAARTRGNQHFKEKNWFPAMCFYSKSLCLAEINSKHVSLAYANRSACLFEMKLYDECLIDIKLAKEAGYPVDLIPKLDKREEKCLNGIKERATPNQYRSKLKFETNKHFPWLSSELELKKDDNGKPLVFSKVDIDVGQMVAMEMVFSSYFYNIGSVGYCDICLKQNPNVVPCKKCSLAMFCYGECEHNDLHQYECGLRPNNEDKLEDEVNALIRTILMSVNLFPNADDLIDFVERAVSSDPNELPDTLSDAKAKYRAFLKLPFKKTFNISDQTFLTFIFLVHTKLLNIQHVKTTFESSSHQRFLMHLVAHHEIILKYNSFFVNAPTTELNKLKVFGSFTTLSARYFKPSCTPNLLGLRSQGDFKLITVQPIKKGEQLTTKLTERPVSDEELKKYYEERGWVCKCTKCEDVHPTPDEMKQLNSDPIYRGILLNSIATPDDEKLQNLLEQCENFLRKYGRFAWCKEIETVTNIYLKYMHTRLARENKYSSFLSHDKSIIGAP